MIDVQAICSAQALLSALARPALKRAALAFCIGLSGLMATTRLTDDAIANGETRTINLYHQHTGESILITFRENGHYVPEALKKLNWFLRDWRKDEPTNMDPELFDLVWEVYREVGAQEAINVVSAYRSAGTNAMLRSRSRAVAKHSQHIQGRAMDMHFPGINMAKVREIGMLLQRGGVGFYPTAGTPFVHLDTGSVRHWPRMSRDQLARLFPDGNTVHIPADGKPMGGYDLAYASVTKRGGRVGGFGEDDDGEYTSGANGGLVLPRGKSSGGGFFAALFGGGRSEPEPTRLRRPPVAVAAARPDPVVEETRVASIAQQPVPNVPAPVQMSFAPLPERAPSAIERMAGGAAPGTLGAQASGLQQAGAAAMAIAFAPVPVARPRIDDMVQVASAASIPLPQARQRELPPLIAFGTPQAEAPRVANQTLAYATPESESTKGAYSLTSASSVPMPAARPSPMPSAAFVPQTRTSALVAPRAASQGGRALQADDKPVVKATQTASLARPDPRAALAEMIGKLPPMAFQRNPGSAVPADRFTGTAVTRLSSNTFTR